MFSVGMLVKDSLEVIEMQIKHFADLGAENIFICYDGKAPKIAAALNMNPRRNKVIFWELEEQFWLDRLNFIPLDFQEKQREAYYKIWRENNSEWLFLCDADERIICRDNLCETLASIPLENVSVRLPTAEAIWIRSDHINIDKPFSCEHFRRPMSDRTWIIQRKLLYGKDSVFFHQNLLGHGVGKQFLRRTARFTHLTSHVAYLDDKVITRPIGTVARVGRNSELAHFDAISFDRWLIKFKRRIDGEIIQGRRTSRHSQQAAIKNVLEKPPECRNAEARELFLRLYCLDQIKYSLLRAQGKAFSACLT